MEAVDWTTALIVALVFLFAGFVKGVVAAGLPTISIALLSNLIGVREAIFITLVPAVLTSLQQAIQGPGFLTAVKRLWPLMLTGVIAIIIASGFALRINANTLSLVAGVVIALYGLAGLAHLRLPSPGAHETWLTPLVGFAGGFLGGLSGMYVMPAVPYIQSLGLKRDALIQSIAIWFALSTLTMAVSLGARGAFTPKLVTMTLIAVVTSLVGIQFGTMARGKLAEAQFMRVFFAAFLALGVFIAWKAWGALAL